MKSINTHIIQPTTLPMKNGVKLDQLLNRWINYLDVRPQSVQTYTRSVRQFLQWLQTRKITAPRREDVLTYKLHLIKTKKPTTVQLYIIAVRQFFRWLEQEGAYKNIAEHIKGARVDNVCKRDYLTSDQIRKVLDGIDKRAERGMRDYAMLLLMVACGLRTVEIARANIEDLRNVGSGTKIFLHGKGRDERAEFVILPRSVETAIRKYLVTRRNCSSSQPLFVSLSNNNLGRRLTTSSVSKIVKKRLVAAGYDSDKITAHSLRHTAVTLALMSGQSLQNVQQFARHTTITTTMIYAHNIDRENNTCAESVARAVLG